MLLSEIVCLNNQWKSCETMRKSVSISVSLWAEQSLSQMTNQSVHSCKITDLDLPHSSFNICSPAFPGYLTHQPVWQWHFLIVKLAIISVSNVAGYLFIWNHSSLVASTYLCGIDLHLLPWPRLHFVYLVNSLYELQK